MQHHPSKYEKFQDSFYGIKTYGQGLHWNDNRYPNNQLLLFYQLAYYLYYFIFIYLNIYHFLLPHFPQLLHLCYLLPYFPLHDWLPILILYSYFLLLQLFVFILSFMLANFSLASFLSLANSTAIFPPIYALLCTNDIFDFKLLPSVS